MRYRLDRDSPLQMFAADDTANACGERCGFRVRWCDNAKVIFQNRKECLVKNVGFIRKNAFFENDPIHILQIVNRAAEKILRGSEVARSVMLQVDFEWAINVVGVYLHQLMHESNGVFCVLSTRINTIIENPIAQETTVVVILQTRLRRFLHDLRMALQRRQGVLQIAGTHEQKAKRADGFRTIAQRHVQAEIGVVQLLGHGLQELDVVDQRDIGISVLQVSFVNRMFLQSWGYANTSVAQAPDDVIWDLARNHRSRCAVPFDLPAFKFDCIFHGHSPPYQKAQVNYGGEPAARYLAENFNDLIRTITLARNHHKSMQIYVFSTKNSVNDQAKLVPYLR